ncbi:MAG TPA: ComEC/Rec2 family competence protein, partial [Terriglobales bacterium]|nr:ComEC/Rec2 family competence protein [Terriglobales bacterium]
MNRQPSAPSAPLHKPAGRQPLLWVVLAYAAGILAGNYLWRPFLWWLVAAFIFGISSAYLLRRRVRIAFLIASSVLFAIGALTIQLRPPAGWARSNLSSLADGEDIVVTAHVIHEGDPRRKAVGETQQRLDLETEQIATESRVLSVRCGIRATVYSKEGAQDGPSAVRLFHYGERLRFPTKLSRPRNYRNPGSFDYQEYLAENGIVALVSTKAENVEILTGFAGRRAELWRTRVYHSIVEQIYRLWPGQEAALMGAMLIGDNTFVGRDLLIDFQRTGTYHVLVISGLKVGILALVTFWLLRRLRVNDLVSSAITVFLTLAYALLTDVGAPVWRATLMLVLYLCARALYR